MEEVQKGLFPIAARVWGGVDIKSNYSELKKEIRNTDFAHLIKIVTALTSPLKELTAKNPRICGYRRCISASGNQYF